MEFPLRLSDYHADAAFAEKLIGKLHEEKPDAVFSYDYFPILSMVCEINEIPYLSWIYDCPQYTLLSGTITNSVNHIFCFDAFYTEKIRTYGAKNVYHLPLGADVEEFDRILGEESKNVVITEPDHAFEKEYGGAVCFVGDLYDGEKNRLRHTNLSGYTAGYVEGLIQAQLRVYGYYLLGDAMKESIAEEIVKKCRLSLGENYRKEPFQMAVDTVGMEVSAREREWAVEKLSEHFPVVLYTGSALPEGWAQKKLLTCRKYADYEKEVPFIFHNSGINLNITSRTIESGIPQRVLDILGCGGFCMTNWQPEIAELFADGEDLVMYTGMEDLLEKTAYYLEKEEERKTIAQKGYEKVKREFGMADRVEKIIAVS